MLSDFVFYNCGVLAAQLLRSQTKNSPQDCFLNATTVQQEIKIYLVISTLEDSSFGVLFISAVSSQHSCCGRRLKTVRRTVFLTLRQFSKR